MEYDTLERTVDRMVGSGGVILAMDESPSTVEGRMKAAGIQATQVNKENYRLVLATADDLRLYAGGAILAVDTLEQRGGEIVKALIERGVAPGVKVDLGLKKFDNTDETYTSGLESEGELDRRIAEYKREGAVFAKWRSSLLISGSDGFPTRSRAIERNANDLAVYARICQEHGIVPIVEPEVRADALEKNKETGEILRRYDCHSIEHCFEATLETQLAVFNALHSEGVYLRGMILKPNMVTPGVKNDSYAHTKPTDVANLTVAIKTMIRDRCGGVSPRVAYLSGGQGPEVFSNLNEINVLGRKSVEGWKNDSASFGREFVGEPLSILKLYDGKQVNVGIAQEALGKRLRAASLASMGLLLPNDISFMYAK